MGLRWERFRDSWRGWRGQLLVGSVVAYEHTDMRMVDGSGLRRLVITGRYHAGFIRGERVGGEYASPAAATRAVDAAHAANAT